MSTRTSQIRAAPRGRERHLRVVRRSSRGLLVRGSTRRLASYAIASSIVVLAIVFAVLLEQVMLAQSAFKLKRIQDQLVEAEMEQRELMLDAAQLESSARIERFARDQLGMIKPDAGSVSYIQADVLRRGDGGRVAEGGGAGDDRLGTAAGAP